jgi:phospholipase C
MIRKNLRWMAAVLLATNLAVTAPSGLMAGTGGPGGKNGGRNNGDADNYQTTTPIKHLVIIFQENVSFDHYFGTYPTAQNNSGETPFHGMSGTPSVDGLNLALLENNPNTLQTGGAPPIRLTPAQNYTCSQNHGYMAEEQAFDSGLMDLFPQHTANVCSSTTYPDIAGLGTQIVMGYFDGNTVTAMWNYSQHFAMNQSFHGTNFGPSTVGAVNVISGMTGNADLSNSIDDSGGDLEKDVLNGSITDDPDPFYDDCGSPDQTSLKGQNIGDLLTEKQISWGWFQGGFTPSSAFVPATVTSPAVPAVCGTKTKRLDGTLEPAYVAHHDPFEYYLSTSNRHHVLPASIEEIGHDGPANHQYDLSYFWDAAFSGNLPAVSYLKANSAQDGHPGNSSPLDEQAFITDTLNKLQSLADWDSTAVIITYDDSDGWYDHVIGPIVNQSVSSEDALTGASACGTGANTLAGLQSRCGYGPRLPFVVISPYAKRNFVDSTVTDQSSVVRFIEDNWNVGRIGTGSFDAIAGTIQNMFDFTHRRRDRVFLDTTTGQVVAVENE